MKVLVVKLSAFGDIIHCLPALDDILESPQVDEVHWLVDERYAFVTEVFPKQVQVHRVRTKGGGRLFSIARTIRQLRRLDFDRIIDLQGLIKSALLARLIGAPVHGFDRTLAPERAASWLQVPALFHPDEKHVVQQYRRIACAALDEGARKQPPEALPYVPPRIRPEDARLVPDWHALADLGLEDKAYVVLQSGGGWQTKRLPERSWLAVATGLLDQGLLPVFSWGNDQERRVAEELALRSNGCALPRRLNMSALAALLMRARAVVGPDTGLVHLAAALGTPTVSFWGPSASWRSAPFGDDQGVRHCHIESNPPCGPCFQRSCEHFICMDAIAPASILEAIQGMT